MTNVLSEKSVLTEEEQFKIGHIQGMLSPRNHDVKVNVLEDGRIIVRLEYTGTKDIMHIGDEYGDERTSEPGAFERSQLEGLLIDAGGRREGISFSTNNGGFVAARRAMIFPSLEIASSGLQAQLDSKLKRSAPQVN